MHQPGWAHDLPVSCHHCIDTMIMLLLPLLSGVSINDSDPPSAITLELYVCGTNQYTIQEFFSNSTY